MSLVPLPQTLIPFLEQYLPTQRDDRPFVTLTWAQSLDARIAAEPGTQTKISHAETKTMTHYLRAYHSAILVGVGTVLADDPKLNCRYGNYLKIRPVVIDPRGRWEYANSTLCRICSEGAGVAPYIVIGADCEPRDEDRDALSAQDGLFIQLPLDAAKPANWEMIFDALHGLGVASVMVEGGAVVIGDLLNLGLVDSLVVTVGPVFLGKNGVEVSPLEPETLKDVSWWHGEADSVLAARI